TGGVASQPAPYHVEDTQEMRATPQEIEASHFVTSDSAILDGQEQSQQTAEEIVRATEPTEANEAHFSEAGETRTASPSLSISKPVVVKQLKNGRVLRVVGEVVYELDA
ncbi:MAG TPA: hypothetical protein DHW02_21110, partial [Ktedonobacter sp.]|nr:hypothetical protein [Ktedonobacter sp.]